MTKIKPDYFQWYLSLPPPRQADVTLQKQILDYFLPTFSRITLYIVPVLMIVASVFIMGTIVSTGNYGNELQLMKGPTAITQGTIFRVDESSGSKGKRQYFFRYTYQPPSRDPITGYSIADRKLGQTGQTVEIEYLTDNPDINCMKDARLSPAPMAVLILLPVITLITSTIPIVFLFWRKKWIFLLLRDGITTTASILAIKRGQKGSRNVDLQFNRDGIDITSKVNVPGQKRIVEMLELFNKQNRQVKIPVDPQKPKRLVIIDTLDFSS